MIGLDNLGVPALGIMSNRMTEAQGEKIARWAKQIGSGRVTLMFDCEPAAWRGRRKPCGASPSSGSTCAWPGRRRCTAGAFAGKQPEALTREDVERLLASGAPS